MLDPIRVLIVDEDPLARRALVSALRRHDDIKVVGTAPDGAAGARMIGELEPDVVVLDGRAPQREAIENARPLTPGRPAILVLSLDPDEEHGVDALRHGVSGYLSKHVSVDALHRVVRALASGEVVLSRAMTTRVVHRLRETPPMASGLRPVRSELSTREWEVLDLLRAGASTRQIAAELNLTVETVRSHIKRVLRKLGIHSRAEAVERAHALTQRHQGRGTEPRLRSRGA